MNIDAKLLLAYVEEKIKEYSDNPQIGAMLTHIKDICLKKDDGQSAEKKNSVSPPTE